MNAKELFSAAIRVVGLLSLARGIADISFVVLFYAGIGESSVIAKAPMTDLIFGLFYFLAGLYLLRGAPFIMDFAFPAKPEEIEPPPPPTFTE